VGGATRAATPAPEAAAGKGGGCPPRWPTAARCSRYHARSKLGGLVGRGCRRPFSCVADQGSALLVRIGCGGPPHRAEGWAGGATRAATPAPEAAAGKGGGCPPRWPTAARCSREERRRTEHRPTRKERKEAERWSRLRGKRYFEYSSTGKLSLAAGYPGTYWSRARISDGGQRRSGRGSMGTWSSWSGMKPGPTPVTWAERANHGRGAGSSCRCAPVPASAREPRSAARHGQVWRLSPSSRWRLR
jgi:hypothetical protein